MTIQLFFFNHFWVAALLQIDNSFKIIDHLQIPHGQKNMIFTTLLHHFHNDELNPCLLIQGGVLKEAYEFVKQILKSSEQNPHGFPDHLVEKQIDAHSYPNFFNVTCELKDDGQMAHEITVEQIRKALHFLHTTPGLPGWRVLLIDTAHKLNRFAANALLKSFEEPPRKTCIILLSASVSALPITLRSRCQVWRQKANQDNTTYYDEATRLFCEKIQKFMGKSIQELERFAHDIGKNPKEFQAFLSLFPDLLYQEFIKTKSKKCLERWEKAIALLRDALHLDKAHLVLALFLITR